MVRGLDWSNEKGGCLASAELLNLHCFPSFLHRYSPQSDNRILLRVKDNQAIRLVLDCSCPLVSPSTGGRLVDNIIIALLRPSPKTLNWPDE
jgi:hypothetical protein